VRDFAELPPVSGGACRITTTISRSREIGFSFRDALTVGSAIKGGADRLLTEDLQHGQEIAGLHIENPFP
jgi:predicted nucleic acid-binding protein